MSRPGRSAIAPAAQFLLLAVITTLVIAPCGCAGPSAPAEFIGAWEGWWSGIPFDPALTDIQQVFLLRVDDSGTMEGRGRIYDDADLFDSGFSCRFPFRGILLGDGVVRLRGTWHASLGFASEDGICRLSGRVDPARGGRLHWDGLFPFFPEADVILSLRRLDEFAP